MAPRSGAPTLSLYSAELSAALPGPEWLQRRRAVAAALLDGASMPSADEEIWRYSRIGELDLGSFAPASGSNPPAPVSEGELDRLRSLGAAAIAITVDGVLAHVELSPEASTAGVSVGPVEAEGLLGLAMAEPADVFARLNDAFCISPVAVLVPRGIALRGPVVVVHVVTTNAIAVFPRLVVHAGDNAEVRVLEQFTSAPVRSLIVPVTELRAERSARLAHMALNQLGESVWQLATTVSAGERDSTTTIASVALGGDYARSRIDARLVGSGAHTEQIAIYFGSGTQTHDFRPLQDHAAPKTTSNLLFKGAVSDHARSVYTGLIKVRKEAPGTVAFQTNRNLKLSEHAWAESVPNLDIETNDVKCSHASTVGPIDADQLFYLESRGVPTDVAERLVVMGFFDEALAAMPIGEVVDVLHRAVAQKLEKVRS